MKTTTDAHLLIFKAGQRYRLTKAINVGFKLDREVQAGRAVEYLEHKFSHYDDCYVYYFKDLELADVFEYWVHKDDPLSRVYENFRRELTEPSAMGEPNQSPQPTRADGPLG